MLHRLAGVPVTEESLASAEESELLGIRIPVQPPTPIMIAKLQSLSEHYSDFGALLPVVRAVREQLDWAELRAATADLPFAEAFLLLCDRLEIAPSLTRLGISAGAASFAAVYVGIPSLYPGNFLGTATETR